MLLRQLRGVDLKRRREAYTVDNVSPAARVSSWRRCLDWRHWYLEPWPSASQTAPAETASSPLRVHIHMVTRKNSATVSRQMFHKVV